LTEVFFFGLPILDRIESSTATIIPCLYSDDDTNTTPARSSSSSLVRLRHHRPGLTDIDTMDFDLCATVHAMVHTVLPSV
jgi:hypothetical protein